MNQELYITSIKHVLESQSKWGSYVASPSFPTYQFCWIRDGSFVAYAMDTAGEYESSAAFFRWAGKTIEGHASKVQDLQRRLELGSPLSKDDFLHTRFTLDGQEVTVDETWGNFQIDGYGTLLWALAEHIRLSGSDSLMKELAGPIQTILAYLELVWKLPNYDLWEEHPEYIHPYTLAATRAGFSAAAVLQQAGCLGGDAAHSAEMAQTIGEFIRKYGISDGRLTKHIHPGKAGLAPRPVLESGVDSSLIGISVPFNFLAPDDPVMLNTIAAIERDLHRQGGGLYRYGADVYYGGGEWLILAAWLGWYYASMGRLRQAEELCSWIESQATASGDLAEQVNDHVLFSEQYDPWVKKWGQVACPLTWSHAFYIILVHAIRKGRSV